MPALALALRLVLAFTFAEALWTHVRTPRRFEVVLRALGIGAPRAVATIVTALDAIIVAALLIEPQSGSIAAIAYLVAVTAPLAWRLAHGQQVADCGCSSKAKPVDRWFFVRNATLAAAAFAVAAVPQPASLDVSAIAALLVAALYVTVRLGLPHLARFLRIAPRDGATPNDPSRRRMLKRASLAGVAGVVLAVLPSAAIGGLGTVAAAATKPKERRFRVGGADAKEIADLRADLRSVYGRGESQWLALVPGALRVDWREAEVWGTDFQSDKFDALIHTVLVPIVDATGRSVAKLVRNTGSSEIKMPTEVSSVTIEDRLQLTFIEGNQNVIVQVGSNGAIHRETRPVSGPTPNAIIDPGGGSCGGLLCFDIIGWVCLWGCACQRRQCCYQYCGSICCTQCNNNPWFLCGIPTGFPCCDFWCTTC